MQALINPMHQFIPVEFQKRTFAFLFLVFAG